MRKNLTQPPEWWTAFQKAASLAGKTLSEWAADAMLAKLPRDVRKKLPERQRPGRPKSDEEA